MMYEVLRTFKYNGRQYKRGDTWEPAGGKFDQQIIGMAENKATPLVVPLEREPNARDLRVSRSKK